MTRTWDPEHKAVFPEDGSTRCTCGKKTVTTYDGWKRHYKAEQRKRAAS